MTVGAVLTGLKERVGGIINNPMASPSEALVDPIVDAAREVSMAIENALVAYDYSTICLKQENAVDNVIKKQLAELREMVTVLESKRTAEITGLYASVQRFILSPNLQPSWQPKYTGITPRYAYIVQGQLVVTISGCFAHAVKYNKATLKVDNASFPLSATFLKNGVLTETTSESLSFTVQASEAMLNPLSRKCRVIKGELEVEYNSGSIFNSYQKATYDVYLGIYPPGPGDVILRYEKREVIKEDKRTTQSAKFSLSRNDIKVEGPVTSNFTLRPSKGWTISGTPKLHIRSKVKDSTEVQTAESDAPEGTFAADHIDASLTLLENQTKVKGYFHFDEVQDVMGEQLHTKSLPLKWEENFDFEASTFRVELKPFEGPDIVLTKDNKTSPYLQVIGSNGTYSLVAKIPKQ